MNNIRKIITERLDNARLDYRYWLSGIGFDGVIEPDFYKIPHERTIENEQRDFCALFLQSDELSDAGSCS